MGTGETLVTVEFKDVDRDARTEIVLTHERSKDEAARDRHGEGWNGCLDHLLSIL